MLSLYLDEEEDNDDDDDDDGNNRMDKEEEEEELEAGIPGNSRDREFPLMVGPEGKTRKNDADFWVILNWMIQILVA